MKRSTHQSACWSVSTCSNSLASAQSSTPACSLGLDVVCLLTWQNAWNTHLWTLVLGHSAATAEAKPLPPSVTTMSGGAMRESSERHAAVVSARARCHDSTCSSLHAMSTTQSRAIQMPST